MKKIKCHSCGRKHLAGTIICENCKKNLYKEELESKVIKNILYFMM
ncbi:MAG: hypothetical protein ACOCP8_00695 [archaeon]